MQGAPSKTGRKSLYISKSTNLSSEAPKRALSPAEMLNKQIGWAWAMGG